MNFSYKKNNNDNLFNSLKKDNILNLNKIQNYIPIYNKFFNLNENNYNKINLNNKFYLLNINKKNTYNTYNATIIDNSNNISNIEIFIKFLPLLDPSKYIADKYDVSNNNLLDLPSFKNNNCESKLVDPFNSAYVDSLFTYLSSKELHNNNFKHGIDFYGSFLAIKNKVEYDISEDIHMLTETNAFFNNINKKFTLLDISNNNLFNYYTRNNKTKINILSNKINIKLDNIENINKLDSIFNNTDLTYVDLSLDDISIIYNCEDNNILDKEYNSDSELSSNCSSRLSNIPNENNNLELEINSYNNHSVENNYNYCNNQDNNNDHYENDNESDNEENNESDNEENNDSDNDNDSDIDSDSDSDDENEIIAVIDNFPVQITVMEKCKDTLDNYINNNIIEENEWRSIIIQILMILIYYKKQFKLTHNDLHTNNIVYKETDEEYLYYKYNNIFYKVPTFGKIYKIIDFGRAIYTYRDQFIFNDSFCKNGDAEGQFNCEPYYNKNKPIIEQNYSFDLCRLGCSLYDTLIDDKDLKTSIKQICIKWCFDDNNKNILYKENGDERYPGFKLYKMITRKVHNHDPEIEIKNIMFDIFVINDKKLLNLQDIMNI